MSLKGQALIDAWLEKRLDGNIQTFGKLREAIRTYLLELAKYKCTKCGWGEINPHTGRVPLTVSHIDGDWTNSWFENLEVLCPNCHSLTDSYCGRNKGKGRPRKYKVH